MEDYKERLKEYVKTDVVYQDFQENETKKFNDFEKFCVEHCQDIEKLLEENKTLKQEITKLKKSRGLKWKRRY